MATVLESAFRDLHRQGKTSGEIATALGISVSQAGRMRRQYQLPAHRQNQKGAANRAWKGGRRNDKSGYVLVYCPLHPYARKGMVREHRLIAEGILGRFLDPCEVVDHIDGNKGNNDPRNLRVYETNALHLADTLKGRRPRWTDAGKERIRLAVVRSNVARGRRKIIDGKRSP